MPAEAVAIISAAGTAVGLAAGAAVGAAAGAVAGAAAAEVAADVPPATAGVGVGVPATGHQMDAHGGGNNGGGELPGPSQTDSHSSISTISVLFSARGGGDSGGGGLIAPAALGASSGAAPSQGRNTSYRHCRSEARAAAQRA
jgi:hypothetical protein